MDITKLPTVHLTNFKRGFPKLTFAALLFEANTETLRGTSWLGLEVIIFRTEDQGLKS